MVRWRATLCGVALLSIAYADAAENVAALKARPECDPNVNECFTIIRVYTTSEVDQVVRKALEDLDQKYEQELSRLKATVETQSQQIAELRQKAGLR
jgi:hypothetical protein